MPLSYTQQEEFYENLVVKLREHGVTCAITSGMACVHYGVAESTKDCDLLCLPEAAERCLLILSETRIGDSLPSYRGNLSPPLDARWMRGGWTSHFFWCDGEWEAYLDVFGSAPRGSSHWELELNGLHASLNTVAEMKRTNRDKDWPFATALGTKLLQGNDGRGWLHIFNHELLFKHLSESECPLEMQARRPVLKLAVKNDERFRPALQAEIVFWHELDRARIKVYEKALRPYVTAVREAAIKGVPLLEQHKVRVACAQKHLPVNPLHQYGLTQLVADARQETAKLVHTALLEWLPDVSDNFVGLK